MEKYHIYRKWKHVQGYIVEDKKTKQPISANSESEAIKIFKSENMDGMGRYIFKNSDGTYRYGDYYKFFGYSPILAIKTE